MGPEPTPRSLRRVPATVIFELDALLVTFLEQMVRVIRHSKSGAR
jgi:hypothetical protein